MAQALLPHAINWFEIPARDLDRATRFYEAILATSLERMTMDGSHMAIFPCEQAGVGGCLVAGDNAPAAATQGTLVYLNAAPSLDAVLARVAAAGGTIETPKTALPNDMGVFATVLDTEGNRVGLHAMA